MVPSLTLNNNMIKDFDSDTLFIFNWSIQCTIPMQKQFLTASD